MEFFSKNEKCKGFTLVELLVSVSIIALISSISLFEGNKLLEINALSGATQQLSLAIREAQSYGISVKESPQSAGQFTYGYGVAFDLSDPYSIFIFSDVNGNSLYDGTTACTSECVEKITIKDNISISQLCAIESVTTCNASIQRFHIAFLRPNPEPIIRFTNNGGQVVHLLATSGRVILTTINGRVKNVTMNNYGRLIVQ